MKAARMVVMAAAILALAGLSARAQESFEAKIKGTIYADGDKGSPDKAKFDTSDALGALGTPGGTLLYFFDGDPFDEEVYVDDANGAFVGFLMFVAEADYNTVGCGTGSKESGTKSTTKATCVELISLFDSGSIDGAATCDYTYTFDSKKDVFTLNKKCHVEAIVPDVEGAPSASIGLPIEFDVSGGKAVASVD